MAGETIKSNAVCLAIRPWSQTSHVVLWLTPHGKIGCVVRGAERPKSAFLGQYDLNYTCEILYYARARGELHALRECVPVLRRDALRGDYRSLALAGYFRALTDALSPQGPDCADWYALLTDALDNLAARAHPPLVALVSFEMRALHLTGLQPELEAAEGSFALRGERTIPISRAVATFLHDPTRPTADGRILSEAARQIGVYLNYHLEGTSDIRRSVLALL